MKSKGNSIELPSLPVVQYNLRSRGRVVGGGGGSDSYLLRRRRGVRAVDNSSGNQHSHRHRRSRKPPSKHPRKVERKAEAQKTVVRSCGGFVVRKSPYPYLAMRHYKETHQESEHYEVSKQIGREIRCFHHVGFLHLVHFTAQRKSVEGPPKLSYFLGLVHQRPHGDVHVCSCFSWPEFVRDGRIDKVIPLACSVCGLDDEAAFELESMRLREEAKALGLPENESLANYKKLYYSDVEKD